VFTYRVSLRRLLVELGIAAGDSDSEWLIVHRLPEARCVRFLEFLLGLGLVETLGGRFFPRLNLLMGV
jgi:hypothetical protein